MTEKGSRIQLGAVAVGVVVAGGCALLPLLLGAALNTKMVESGLRPLDVAVAVWLAGTVIAAGYLGGRFAAVSGRALQARDGGLYGLVTWCAWSLVAVAAAALGPTWIGQPDLVHSLGTSAHAQLSLVAFHAAALGASIAGGIRGARSEALAAGAWPVYLPADDFEPTPSAYAAAPAPVDDGEGVYAD